MSKQVSNSRRKFIKKAAYTTPVLLSLGSLTKPQVAGGSHVAPIEISGDEGLTREQSAADYNPLFDPVHEWFDTTRFWGGGLTVPSSTYNFDANRQARYLDTYGFAQMQYGLEEPKRYDPECMGFMFQGDCFGETLDGYTSLRENGDARYTTSRELTRAEYLLTRSFEQERALIQSVDFSTRLNEGTNSNVRSLIGLDGANNDQIRAHYELASYNYYTREILGVEFGTLEEIQEWQATFNDRDLGSGRLAALDNQVLNNRLIALNRYDNLLSGTEAGEILDDSIAGDVIRIINENENGKCRSIKDVFDQLCGFFDPYRVR